jgi:hypothetical protein
MSSASVNLAASTDQVCSDGRAATSDINAPFVHSRGW